jgi:hypothetical protein
MANEITLKNIVNDPAVARYVGPGLSGKVAVDNLIYAVKEADARDCKKGGYFGQYLDVLKVMYPLHFLKSSGVMKERKRDCHKAINGF